MKSTSTVNFDMSISSKEEFVADHPEIHFGTLMKLVKKVQSSKFENALNKLYEAYNLEKCQNDIIQKDNLELLEKVTKNQEVIDLLQEQIAQVLEQNSFLKSKNKEPDRERLQLLKENELLQETIDSIQDNNRQLDKIVRENRQLKEQKNRMQRMLNELSKKETEMCFCQIRKSQLESKYSKSVQRPRRDTGGLKTPQ